MNVVIMAGGTGGHIFPALAAAEELRCDGDDIVWIGTRHGMEARLVPAADIPIHYIGVTGLRGKGWRTRLAAPATLLRAVSRAVRLLWKLRPHVALGMGGFASGPGGIAAWLTRCPLVIHEQNAVPGFTNRVLAHFATTVLEAFPNSFPAARQAQCVGNPVRASIAALPPPAARFRGRRGRPRALVLGGSQGAAVLNTAVPAALANLAPERRPQLWHQTGERHFDAVASAYQNVGIEPNSMEAFIDDMAAAYAWADFVICRAGALTVAELTAAGLGAILVPFAGAVDDHQTRNAALLVGCGAAMIVPQREATPSTLAGAIGAISGDRERLLEMAQLARAQARPNAARDLAQACVNAAGGRR